MQTVKYGVGMILVERIVPRKHDVFDEDDSFTLISKRGCLGPKSSLTSPLFIEVSVSNRRNYVSVSTIFLLDFETLPTVAFFKFYYAFCRP